MIQKNIAMFERHFVTSLFYGFSTESLQNILQILLSHNFEMFLHFC
jgi:hypothetical protein